MQCHKIVPCLRVCARCLRGLEHRHPRYRRCQIHEVDPALASTDARRVCASRASYSRAHTVTVPGSAPQSPPGLPENHNLSLEISGIPAGKTTRPSQLQTRVLIYESKVHHEPAQSGLPGLEAFLENFLPNSLSSTCDETCESIPCSPLPSLLQGLASPLRRFQLEFRGNAGKYLRSFYRDRRNHWDHWVAYYFLPVSFLNDVTSSCTGITKI